MSSGLSAAATTSTTTPSPGEEGSSADAGGRPSSEITAARTRGSLDLLQVAPLLEDLADLPVERLSSVRGGHLVLCNRGEHLRDEELVEDLVHARVREPRVTDVRRVALGDRRQDRVLPLRLVRVLRGNPADALEAALHRVRPRREVVEAAVLEVVVVVELLVDDVLLGARLVLGELPDHVDAHHVLEPEAVLRAARDRRDPGVVGDR